MKFLSVCSGIEAASVAWNPLGWKAVAFSEIEPFPCAVLAHHYPDVPNFGDMTKFQEWPDLAIDLLCGGTPCQSFSVAGLRKGLDDPRGNLMLTFGAIAARYRPRWLVWENVPGVLSSNEGRDFGAFLGMLGQLGYGFAYRVLDAQYFGVAQRRRRVFVVGCLGDWRSAAAVLFERHSMQGHPAPSREARKRLAPTLDASFGRLQGCSGQDANHGHGHLIPLYSIHPHCIGRSPDAGPQGKEWLDDGSAYTQDSRSTSQAIAFGWQNSASQGASASEHHSPTLDKSKTPAVAFKSGQSEAAGGIFVTEEFAPTLQAQNNGSTAVPSVMDDLQVRRLTPTECERLQGFPDGYTLIPLHNKSPSDVLRFAADAPRYKALGNSWAVPNVRWIGERIALVDALSRNDAEIFAKDASYSVAPIPEKEPSADGSDLRAKGMETPTTD